MIDAEISAIKFLEGAPHQGRAHALAIDSVQALRASLGTEGPAVFVVAASWIQVLLGFRDVIVHEPSVGYDHWDRVLAKLREARVNGEVMAVLKTPKRKGAANFAATVQAIFDEARKLKVARAMVIVTLPHDALLDLAQAYGVRLRQVMSHDDVKKLVPLDGGGVPAPIEAAFPGKAPLAAYVRALATRAVTSPHVLLRGPSGTGKRVLAQAIHAAGSPDGPFQVVRCGAFPDDHHLDRALFGHAQAGVPLPGAWEIAREGTLFLEEIADLPSSMQKRIAGLLRDGVAGPRIIATTREPVDEADSGTEQQGDLDDELVLRLLPMSIRMPSLAERGDDFDAVVDTAWKRVGGEAGLAGDVRVVLRRRLWRSNIRGLKSFLTRMLGRFGQRPTREQVEALLREMEPVARGWGTEVRLPAPDACAAFLEGVRGLLRESIAALAPLGRTPAPLEAEVSALILGQEDRLGRMGDLLREPFAFADQTAWRRVRVARDLLAELGDRPAGQIVEHWREQRGRQVFAQAETAVGETIEWLRGLG